MCESPVTSWHGSYPVTKIIRVSSKSWTSKQMIRAWRLLAYYKKSGITTQGQSYFVSPYNDIGKALRQNELI